MIHDQSKRADRCVQYTTGLQGMLICAGPTGATLIASIEAVIIAISHEPASFTFSLCNVAILVKQERIPDSGAGPFLSNSDVKC